MEVLHQILGPDIYICAYIIITIVGAIGLYLKRLEKKR